MNLPQTSNIGPNSNSTGGTQTVSAPGNDLPTTLAAPDAHAGPLDGVLSAEGATVGGVLGDLDLTKELTEGGTVTGTVFSGDSDLSCAVLTHLGLLFICVWSREESMLLFY